jgi:DNA-binding response OmpR family regulator
LPLILVVEDEYLLQRNVEEALIDGGFATDAIFSGEEALTLFMSGTRKYKALVTDVNLGGELDGWEVAKRIREKDGAFPVVYMTGDAVPEWASHGVPNSVLVPKPFALAQLVTAVSSLLNAGTSPPPT